MDAITSVLIGKALDGLSLRQMHLSQNIANANSAEYTPMSVDFEAALKAASTQGMTAAENIQPTVAVDTKAAADDDMRLDLQLAESSKTALRYSALIEVLNRQMSLARAAISEGGR